MALMLVATLGWGCSSDADRARADADRADVPVSDSAGLDASAAACRRERAIRALDALLRTHLDSCHSCHDATRAPGRLQEPGPPWLVGYDARATFDELLARQLIDAREPLQSALLMRPLSVKEGGWIHKGGDVFSRGDASYRAVADFVSEAARCVDR